MCKLKDHISEDFHLVRCLTGAVFTAFMVFTALPGNALEDMGFISLDRVDYGAQLAALGSSGPQCGNGLHEPSYGEQCDDGNTVTGDGCNIICEIEYGRHVSEPIECSDGIDNDLDGVVDMDDGGCLSKSDDDEWNSLGNEFYVSSNGNDTNIGSLSSPLKTIQYAMDKAQPGDTVFVRGGTYNDGHATSRGPINIEGPFAGAEHAPIMLKAYQDERVIIDGTLTLSWTSCTQSSVCDGFSNTSSLYVADLPAGLTAKSVNLLEGNRTLALTRNIPAPDSFYGDDVSNAMLVKAGVTYTTTQLQDSEVFTSSDPDYFKDAFLHINSCNNNFQNKKITAFDPTTDTITFEEIGCAQQYLEAEKNRFAIANHRGTLKKGEFFVDEANQKLMVWPLEAGSVNGMLRLPAHTYGISLHGSDNLMIDGFEFFGFVDTSIINFAGSGTTDNLVVKKNRFSQAKKTNIYFHESNNLTFTRNNIIEAGANIFSKGNNVDVSYNYVTRSFGSGLTSYTNTNARFHHNTHENSHAHHGNGLTLGYLGNDRLLVEFNHVRNANIPITTQASKNITYRGNILIGGESGHNKTFAGWSGSHNGITPDNVVFEYNTFVSADDPTRSSVYLAEEYTHVVFKNNIIAWPHWGGEIWQNATGNNNLFTGNPSALLDSGTDMKQIDIAEIFVDPYNNDFRIKEGTPYKTMASDGGEVGAHALLEKDSDASDSSLHPSPQTQTPGTDTFSAGDRVQTIDRVNIRQSPGAK